MTGSKQMKTVFIASPYTVGDSAVNVRQSLDVADELLVLGLFPFCPLLFHFWHFMSPKSYDTWCDIDNVWLLKCDAVYCIEGISPGATSEVALAMKNNIPVVYSMSAVKALFNVRSSRFGKKHRKVNP
jgi:hypothetical protein